MAKIKDRELDKLLNGRTRYTAMCTAPRQQLTRVIPFLDISEYHFKLISDSFVVGIPIANQNYLRHPCMVFNCSTKSQEYFQIKVECDQLDSQVQVHDVDFCVLKQTIFIFNMCYSFDQYFIQCYEVRGDKLCVNQRINWLIYVTQATIYSTLKRIYIVGGIEVGKQPVNFLQTCCLRDLQEQRHFVQMKFDRVKPCVKEFGQELYVWGGSTEVNSQQIINVVEIFNAETLAPLRLIQMGLNFD